MVTHRRAAALLAVIVLLFMGTSALAQARSASLASLTAVLTEELTVILAQESSELEGMVVFRQTDAVYLDLALEDGVVIGQTFAIERPGEQILHPATNEVLGVARTNVGTAQVDWIDANFSRARIVNETPNNPIRVRDIARAQESAIVFVASAPHADGRRTGLSLAVEKALADAVESLPGRFVLAGDQTNRYGLGRGLTPVQARQLAVSYRANVIITGRIEESAEGVAVVISVLDGGTGALKGRAVTLMMSPSEEMAALMAQLAEAGSAAPVSSPQTQAPASTQTTPPAAALPSAPSAPPQTAPAPQAAQGFQSVAYQEDAGQIVESLPIKAIDMAVADLDGDGLNELVVIGRGHIMICRWDSYGLRVVWEETAEIGLNYIDVDAADVTGDGKAEILLCNMPGNYVEASVLAWNGSGAPTKLWSGSGWMLRAAAHPDGNTRFYAQSYGYYEPFQPGIMELTWTGNAFVSRGTDLPRSLTLYDFAFLTDDKIAFIDFGNGLRLVNTAGDVLWRSGDQDYGGSDVEITSKDSRRSEQKREGIAAFNLDGAGPHELIVIQNLEASNRFLSFFQLGRRARYSKGRIAAFALEGSSLVERWTTQEYDGYFIHAEVADANNDGVQDVAALQASGDKVILRLIPLD